MEAREQKWMEIDRGEFLRNFESRGFYIRHRLVEHSLFSLPRLIELSKVLPEKDCEYNAGNVPVSLDPILTPRTGLSIQETIRRIENCSSWMVLKNVEQDSDYKALMDACLDQVQQLSESIVPGMTRREAFVFVSSPGSVTPYHLDPEHNILLQIRGNKTLYQFDREDRRILQDHEIERTFFGTRNLVFKDEYQRLAQEFILTPGLGVHVPVTTPHWVKNGNGVSISFSITFRSNVSIRRERIHKLNAMLRKSGLRPRPIGRAPISDSLKYASVSALAAAMRIMDRKQGNSRRYT